MQQRLTVSEATALIKECIEQGITPLWVEGEISNFVAHRSGHFYFSIKDSAAQLRCVMFRGANRHLRFLPQDGMQCLAFGRITVYERSGQYQLVAERLQPLGEGELQLAYARLKQKLHEEGLFDPRHKRPIPAYPETIGVVTSSTGAAIRDIQRVLRRRWPPMRIILRPALVQGSGAAADIVSAIESFNRREDIDLLIVGRGGGSLEDLWAFNEEVVARAIAASRWPVISAVGHEIDETIADFAADLRAATPSAAAELATPDFREVLAASQANLLRCRRAAQQTLARLRLRLQAMERSQALRSPLDRVRQASQRGDELLQRALLALRQVLRRTREKIDRLDGRLSALNPEAVLDRGYALAFDSGGRLVTSATAVDPGDALQVMLSDGGLHCRIERREMRPRRAEPGASADALGGQEA